MIEVHQPPGAPDTLALSGLDLEAATAKTEWQTVLGFAEAAARGLGGRSLVSSHELIELAERHGLAHADSAAYAVFWGEHGDAQQASGSAIVATSWPEVMTPDMARVQELIWRIRGEMPSGK